jgi:hypothetical protein
MKKNKTGKPIFATGRYLKYAIGEIVLVVIGILIAVAINSKYNASQNEKKIKTILTQVQKELLIDMLDAKRIYGVFIQKDSLSRKIISDSVTIEMFKENPSNILITNNYVSFSNKKGGYERLMQNLENLPENYSSLLSHFNTLYVEMQNDIDDYNTHIKNTVMSSSRTGLTTNPKFTDYALGKFPQEGVDYFLNDPFLKNRTYSYINDLGNITQAANDYRIESIVLYKKIDSLLRNESKEYSESLSVLPKKEVINPYLGDYTRIGGTQSYPDISIGIEKEQLIIYRPTVEKAILYWDHDMYFFEKEVASIFKFYENKKGKRLLEFSDGVNNIIMINKKDL